MLIYTISPLADYVKQIHLPTHKAQYRQYDISYIHDLDRSNPEAFLDILIFPHDHEGLSLTKQGVRGDKGIQLASTLHS